MTAQLPSKVRLAQIASFSKSMALPPSHDEIEAMARFALAAHEQEPVAYSLIFRNMDGVLNSGINTNTTFATREKAEAYGKGGRYEAQNDGLLKWVADENLDPVVVPLYTQKAPVPALPKTISVRTAMAALDDADSVTTLAQAYKMGWNACRAAMLNGGKS